jgi:putative cell wall-binding protein
LKKSHRNRLVVGLAVVMAGASIVAISPWSSASHGGLNGPLTASNGNPAIFVEGGGQIDVGTNVTFAQWSPDGSRALYQSDEGEILTVRFDDGTNVWPLTLPTETAGQFREHPTWLGDGYGVVWSEQPAAGEPWHLRFQFASFLGGDEQITPANDGFNYTEPDAGPGSLVVMTRQAEDGGAGTGPPDVYRLDPTVGPDPILVVTDGHSPAVSPNGAKVAFVRGTEIFTVNLNGTGLNQVTDTGVGKGDPTWSPDGAMLAFRTGADVAEVASNASGATTVNVVAGLHGVPAYRSERVNAVVRLAGAGRFATAAAVSRAYWDNADGPDGPYAQSVVLSRSDFFADALGGGALAAAKEGPLLLTPPSGLNPITQAEMVRVLGTSNPASKTVYLLGSEIALSATVKNQVEDLGYSTVRLAGGSRYSTAIEIAKAIDPTPNLILAATGLNFPDALAAGAAAGSYNVPGASDLTAVVVLTQGTAVPAALDTFLDANPGARLFGIGDPAVAAVGSYGGEGVAGMGRYATAERVAEVFFSGETYAGVATGENWPDALSGGALMANLNGPLLLTKGHTGALRPETAFMLDVHCGSVDTAFIFGSAKVVTNTQAGEVGIWISGDTGFDTFPIAGVQGPALRNAGPGGRLRAPDVMGEPKLTADELVKVARALPTVKARHN